MFVFDRVGVDRAAAHVDRGFGFVLELLDGEDAVDVGHVVEVPLELGELRADVVAQGFRDVDVMASDAQLHDFAPSAGNYLIDFSHPTNLLRLRSLDDGIFIASRYFATVRRATVMPSFGQHLRDLIVAERLLRVLAAHELADLRAHGRRRLLAFLAGDVAREEIAELEHAARRVHVFVGGDARDGRLVHLDGFGDVAQHHRPHVLFAVLEEFGLPLHDRERDLEQRLVADFQAANQPARLLELGP